jgi:hypothetical protein
MANPYYPQLYDRDWLIQAYVTERRSQAEIAAEIGCSGPPMRRALKRFDIALRSATEQRDLSPEDVEAWAAKGGAALNRPIGPTEHKAAAEELRRLNDGEGYGSVDDLIVLVQKNDPFYCGTPDAASGSEPDGEGLGARGWLALPGHVGVVTARADVRVALGTVHGVGLSRDGAVRSDDAIALTDLRGVRLLDVLSERTTRVSVDLKARAAALARRRNRLRFDRCWR